MPTGIYDRTKSKPNTGIFKKGEHRSPNTEFKRGEHSSPKTEFKKGIGYIGERNFYTSSDWIRRQSESHKGQHSSTQTEFKKGNHYSPDTEFKLGQPQIYFPLGSNRPEFSGKKHPNWKGGISPIQSIIRNTGRYHEWRINVFKRDNYTCQDCGLRGGKLNAHHIISFSDIPLLLLDVNNGMTLCKKCHKLKHKKEVM